MRDLRRMQTEIDPHHRLTFAASVRACSSVSDRSPSRASASFRTMSLYLPSCRMFSSEEMIASTCVRPSAVFPMSTSCRRAGAAAASLRK